MVDAAAAARVWRREKSQRGQLSLLTFSRSVSWKKVVYRKKGTASKGPLQTPQMVDSPIGQGTAQSRIPSLDPQVSGLERALVVYGKEKSSSKQQIHRVCGQEAPTVKKDTMAFNNFVPNDLSRAELKIRNSATNVLIFNEELGVFVNPSFYPHYQNIRDKAGSSKSSVFVQEDGEVDDDEEDNIPTPAKGSMSSKHYSTQSSQ